MKSVACNGCGKGLRADEIALNQRLLGMQIGTFLCMACLAEKLHTTSDRLNILTVRFKEMGCAAVVRIAPYALSEQEDIRTWMPDEEHFGAYSLPLPGDLEPGTYELRLGFPTGLPQRPALMLAIENEQNDGFYLMGHVTIAPKKGVSTTC